MHLHEHVVEDVFDTDEETEDFFTFAFGGESSSEKVQSESLSSSTGPNL